MKNNFDLCEIVRTDFVQFHIQFVELHVLFDRREKSLARVHVSPFRLLASPNKASKFQNMGDLGCACGESSRTRKAFDGWEEEGHTAKDTVIGKHRIHFSPTLFQPSIISNYNLMRHNQMQLDLDLRERIAR